MNRDQALAVIIGALNQGDPNESCRIDRDGRIFDSLLGEYGTVILSADQLNNLVKLISKYHEDQS
jgi:hypothetical protein